MAEKLTDAQVEAIRRLHEAGWSLRRIAREVGCGASTVAHYRPGPAAAKPIPRKVKGDGDTLTIEDVSPKRIVTKEDAEEFAQVDKAVWYVDSYDCTAWELGMRMRGGKDVPDQYRRETLWRVSIKLKRIVGKSILDGLDLVFERYTKKPFRLDPPKIRVVKPGRTMMEINIPDLHLGKLCWAPETGHDYDLKIAERIYRNAVATHLTYAKAHQLEQIVLMVGSDFFHYDTPAGTTTSGTPLDYDGRHAKMFDLGVRLKIWAVSALLEECARIVLKLVEGNHDGLSSHCLARAVHERYYHDDRVTVDFSPNIRKYERYGVNLIGYTHGHDIKPKDLPLIMASERKQDWAETTCREWHLGHLHTSKMFQAMPVDEHVGVEVIVVSSPSGNDAWHHKHGFVGNTRASRSFVYDRELGKIATYNAVARDAA